MIKAHFPLDQILAHPRPRYEIYPRVVGEGSLGGCREEGCGDRGGVCVGNGGGVDGEDEAFVDEVDG